MSVRLKHGPASGEDEKEHVLPYTVSVNKPENLPDKLVCDVIEQYRDLGDGCKDLNIPLRPTTGTNAMYALGNHHQENVVEELQGQLCSYRGGHRGQR